MKKHLIVPYLLLTALIANASYLSYKYAKFYYMGGFLTADCSSDCDSVMMSKFALIFGIPVPFYGLAFFLFLAFTFAFGIIKNNCNKAKMIFSAALLLGCLGALSFIYLLYAVLHLHCPFCMFSHVCLFMLTLYYFLHLKDKL